jgi:hypothetical protein
VKFNQVRWEHREYHEKKFDDINRFHYRIGGIFSDADILTKVGVNFIGKLLTNNAHGVLMEWLRNDLGWCYEIDFSLDYYINPYVPHDWELFIPLNNRKQVVHVKKEIHGRILKAISDKKLLALEVERQKCDSIFYYQTLYSIMDDADTMLGVGGRIYTETEYTKILDKCKDPAFLKEIYDKYFSPKVVGEFLAMPK